MTGDMMEARRHIENLMRLVPHGYLPPDEQYEVDAAQTFLDGEGQRVEGGGCDLCREGPDTAYDSPAWRANERLNTEAENLRDELTRLKAEQSAIRNAALEEAAKICEQQAQVFLSPQYAIPQPIGSISERFACAQCAEGIRALIPQPNGGQT